MPRKFEHGDLVVIRIDGMRGTSHQRYDGKIGKIALVQRCCVDYHKAHYENFYTVKLLDGTHVEDLEHQELEAPDAVTALGSVTEDPEPK